MSEAAKILDSYIPERIRKAIEKEKEREREKLAAEGDKADGLATDAEKEDGEGEGKEGEVGGGDAVEGVDSKPAGWSLEDEAEDEADQQAKADAASAAASSLDQYESQLPLVSEQAPLTGAKAAEDEESAFSSSGGKPMAVASSLKRGRRVSSKWGEKPSPAGAAPIAQSRAAALATPASIPVAVLATPAADVDPLDAFMTSLYGAGDVETQKELTAAARGKHAINMPPPAALPLFTAPAAATAAATVESGEEEYDEGKIFYGEGTRVNPFGSNYITMEDIMSQITASGSTEGGRGIEAAGTQKKRHRAGWESDAVGAEDDEAEDPHGQTGAAMDIDPNETEAEREAREEREKQEFIEAIRKAREEEERAREKLRELDSLKAQEAALAAVRKESMGRVFAGEGDIIDEVEVLEKKKTALEMLEEAKRGKMLKEIDHSKIEYLPFRKNLYIVPRALSKLSDAEVLEKREDLHVKVRGKGCPVPVDTWEQCGLSDRILQIIHKHALKEPFPIQKQAIPAIMCGR
jgi:hypothetical protein